MKNIILFFDTYKKYKYREVVNFIVTKKKGFLYIFNDLNVSKHPALYGYEVYQDCVDYNYVKPLLLEFVMKNIVVQRV